MYAYQYFSRCWPLSDAACVAFTTIRYINAFADWMSLGFIAVNRCLGMIRPIWTENYMTGWRGVAIIMAIWAYAIGLVVPTSAEVILAFAYI